MGQCGWTLLSKWERGEQARSMGLVTAGLEGLDGALTGVTEG